MKQILLAGAAALLFAGSAQAAGVAITTDVDHPHRAVVTGDRDSDSTVIIKKHHHPHHKKVVIIKKDHPHHHHGVVVVHHDDDGDD